MELSASSACCVSKEEKDAADAARFGLPDPRELEDDPVLAGCCEEDLRNMRLAEALRHTLLDADRSTVRQKQVLQVLQVPQPQQAPGASGEQLDGDDGDGEDDDEYLAELRRRRLAELQRQAVERRQQSDQGFGRLNDVPPGALLDRVEQLGGPGPGSVAVAHLAVVGCEAGALLDEHLTHLAHRYRGTFFARVPLKRGDPLVGRLRLEGLPALVCFRSGALIGRALVSQFGPPGCLIEEEVTSYLQRLRVLRVETAGQGGLGAAGPGGDASDMEDGEDEEEWKLKPCDVCGRRYPHEHVRAVYGTCGRRDSDSSADEEQ